MLEHTLIDIQQRLKQPIAKATGLPNERYVQASALDEDRRYVAGQVWSCIAFAEDIPEKNYVLPIDFMGIPLVITRDNNNELRVFHNVCSHRGMHLADKPCQTNGMLVCPYHSWTYKMNGELRAFEDYIAPLTQQFNEFCSAEDRLTFKAGNTDSRTVMTVKSNWKLPVENYLESYHLPTVHPELNKTSPLDVHFDLERFANGGGQGSESYTRLKLNDSVLPHLPSWPSAKENLALYPVLYPNTLIGLHSDHLFIMYLQPTSHEETVEHVRISYVGDESLGEQYHAHRKSLLDTWTNVFKEDIFAVERMQKGRASPGYEGGKFSPAMDAPTVHFHEWVADQLVKHA